MTNNIHADKSADPLSASVLEDPKEVLKVPHRVVSSTMCIAEKIFIIPSYIQLLSLITTGEDKAFEVLGTPGVGKSHFVILFAYFLIKRGIPFIFDAEYTDDKHNFYLLKSDGDLVCANLKAIREELDACQECWYIVDGCKLREFSCSNMKMLFVDTSKASNMRYFQRNHPEAPRYYLPCWNIDELKSCMYIVPLCSIFLCFF